MTRPSPPGQTTAPPFPAAPAATPRARYYRHRKGGLYRELARQYSRETLRTGQQVEVMLDGGRTVTCEVTDEVLAGRRFVAYVSLEGRRFWLRPEAMFVDGRFIPVTTPLGVSRMWITEQWRRLRARSARER